MPIRSLRHPVSALIALALALGLAGSAGVAAQGTTQTTPPPDLSGTIIEGTCQAGGQAVLPVGEFIRIDQSQIVGSQDIAFSLRAQRTVQGSIDDLFGQIDYAFVVTDNTTPGGDPIACGNLGGVNVNGQVTIALTAPDPAAPDRDLIVGVAVFGATTPEGPTTQPAAQPGQLPVQAYLSEEALTPVLPTAPVQQPQQPVQPTAPASPTAAPSTPIPTQEPTMMPTMAPTMPPTAPPTAPPTSPPTAPPTSPPTVDATVT